MASLWSPRKRREGDFWKVTSPLTSRWWKKNTRLSLLTSHATPPAPTSTVGALIATATESELTFIQKNVGNISVIPGHQIVETDFLSIQGPFSAKKQSQRPALLKSALLHLSQLLQTFVVNK